MSHEKELVECLATAIGERDAFLPIIYAASKLPCTRLEFEPDDCALTQPDQSLWCIPCKAKDVYECADEDSYHKSQILVEELI